MSVFNTDPQLAAMREEIASRELGVKTKRGLLTALGGIAGVVGGMTLAPSLLPEGLAATGAGTAMALQGAMMGGGAGLVAGGAIGDYLTTAEKKRIEIDQRILDANIQNISNRGYWEAYNAQVVQANRGNLGQLPAPPVIAAAPPQGPQIVSSRRA